jgi:deoxyribodipyrimidine photo-lyase
VPAIRVHRCNEAPLRGSGEYVLYWMIAARRLSHNFALDHALQYCREFGKPLLVLEALRCDYRWASDRLHRFVIDGMADNQRACEKAGVSYFPYLEPAPGAGRGLLAALAMHACLVVTDQFPCFFLPQMVAAAAKKLSVRLDAVDSNGLLPLRAAQQAYPTAYAFRRFLQKELPAHLSDFPSPDPLQKLAIPRHLSVAHEIAQRWRPATTKVLEGRDGTLKTLPIDHHVQPGKIRGGHSRAGHRLKIFLEKKLQSYGENRNEPELDVASGMSPYLHFGHISVHEVFTRLAAREKWKPVKLALRGNGSRQGWWNMTASAEGFLDELITWRELGYNFSAQHEDYDQFESLPAWALQTLRQHAKDQRLHLYSAEQLESAKTHDALWNAAQMQLVTEGRMHNYLRMLWGKKILEWSRTPQEASATLIHLNNKYALDGRNPNSYSGIFWCLGRYDRPWGPERPVFGKVRYMSSENTARKLSVKNYIRRFNANRGGLLAVG